MADVGAAAVACAREAFGSNVACAILLDQAGEVRERTIYGLRDADFEEWARDWRPLENVFPTALARGEPVHAGQVYTEHAWRTHAAYTGYAVRLKIHHYMAAPIFGSRGTLEGALTICRGVDGRSFERSDLARASVCAGFLSATLARVMEAPAPGGESEPPPGLSRRELQIARLAAEGRNNSEIALQLGLARETVKQTLRRAYTKLDVSGRAPMAAKLASRGLVVR